MNVMLIRALSWSALKTILGTRFTGAVALIPIIGYVLIINDAAGTLIENFERKLLELLGNESKVEPVLSLIKLRLIYLGLWAIGFATLLFSVFCPKEIKNHKDEREFIEYNIAVSNRASYKSLISELKSGCWYDFAIANADHAKLVNSFVDKQSVTAQARGFGEFGRKEWIEKNVDGLNLCYSAKYQKKDFCFLPIRYLIFILFFCGLAMTMYPSLSVFVTVASSFFR